MRTLALTLTLALPALAAAGPEDDVKATLRAMWDALERGDLADYAAHVHEDFTAFGENDVYLAEGKELELRSYGAYLKRAKNTRTEMHQPQVTVKGDVAFVLYYWTESAEVEGKRVTSRGKSTRIFVRENGRWLSRHGHYTAVP